MDKNVLWWNVFTSWLKFYDIYEPFRKRFLDDNNKEWLKRHKLNVENYGTLLGKLDYDFLLWAFDWHGDNISFNGVMCDWYTIHNNWTNFRIFNKTSVEYIKKYDRKTIKKLTEYLKDGKNR